MLHWVIPISDTDRCEFIAEFKPNFLGQGNWDDRIALGGACFDY